jgi:tetratricopeptide (TPR) repeat protein
MKNFEECARALEKVCEIDPNDIETLTRLGYLYTTELGDGRRALSTLDRAYQLSPSVKIRNDMAKVAFKVGYDAYAVKSYQDAVGAYTYSSQLDPALEPEAKRQIANAYTALGDEAARAGNLAQAVEDYRAAIAADANKFGAYMGLGLAHIKEGRLDSATAVYEQFKAVNPTWAEDLRKKIDQARKT